MTYIKRMLKSNDNPPKRSKNSNKHMYSHVWSCCCHSEGRSLTRLLPEPLGYESGSGCPVSATCAQEAN